MSTIPAGQEVLYASRSKLLSLHGRQRVQISAEHLHFEHGLFSTRAEQVPLSMVFDIDYHQSFLQKMMGLGSIVVLVSRPHGVEQVILADFPDAREMLAVLNTASEAARAADPRTYRGFYPGQVDADPDIRTGHSSHSSTGKALLTLLLSLAVLIGGYAIAERFDGDGSSPGQQQQPTSSTSTSASGKDEPTKKAKSESKKSESSNKAP